MYNMICVVCVRCRTSLVTGNDVICMYFRNGFTNVRLSDKQIRLRGCRSAAPLSVLAHSFISALVAVSAYVTIATIYHPWMLQVSS